MRIFRVLCGAVAVAAVVGVAVHASRPAAAHRKTPKHLLVITLTKGFRHTDSINAGEPIVEALGKEKGDWDTDFVRTDEDMATKMTASALKNVDAVMFLNTTGVLPLPDPQAFYDWLKAGHGYVGTHSAADTFHPGAKPTEGQVSDYGKMLGAEFQIHHRQCEVDGHIVDPKFPGVKSLLMEGKKNTAPDPPYSLQTKTYMTGTTWKVFDENYLYINVDRPSLHVIIAYDKHPDDGSPEANQPGEYLGTWSRAYGNGRVFYTSFGHRAEVWRDPVFQQFLAGGIRFALGIEKGSTNPNKPMMAKN